MRRLHTISKNSTKKRLVNLIILFAFTFQTKLLGYNLISLLLSSKPAKFWLSCHVMSLALRTRAFLGFATASC